MPTREEMRSLAEDIVGSYADRIAGVAQIKQDESERKRTANQEIAQRKSDVSTMLKEFDDNHAAMSQELKADLSKVAPAIKQAEGERKRTATQEIAQRKSDVSTMLKGFDDNHAAMSQELKADLSKVAPAIKQAEGERKRTATQEIAQRKSDVSTMLKEFHEEQAGVRDEWQTLTATMQSKRGGVAIAVKPAEAVAAPAEEITEEGVTEITPITPETADISGRTFEYLANHPDGTKLVELEQEFGVTRIEMARLLKDLMDENKVEKRELHYFAI